MNEICDCVFFWFIIVFFLFILVMNCVYFFLLVLEIVFIELFIYVYDKIIF